ncbi:hypothetical protein [Oceanirhabdus sp. W0125-5]|uniref:hypothetical protein n=1 Tax=Oceanirhabdus sp. W0125-5 TaxID=2999116 RepID=UPI0022F302E4|nr:hypothetical protein [Oceanirhabdus sp. W0125-5]WBW98899.1 hypothetical protein OW730_09190 [Oceanirhabdus sp. W0125-5]
MGADKIKQNTEFISKVWDKVEELEQIEKEKQIIAENKRRILKLRIRNFALLSSIYFLSFILIRVNNEFSQFVVYATGVLLLTVGNIIQNNENESKILKEKTVKNEKWGYSYGN